MPDLTKQLIADLKSAGVKATRKGKHAIAVDDRSVAQVYDAANDSIRLFVTTKTLPAKLAKPFTKTQTRGYAKRFTTEDDLTPAVAAIVHVATQQQPEPKPAKTKTMKTKSDDVVDETKETTSV